MDRLSNWLNQPALRFVILGLLFFAILRTGLALVNDYLSMSGWVSTLLALLGSGLAAYKIVWRRH